jgi:hypothetical protein
MASPFDANSHEFISNIITKVQNVDKETSVKIAVVLFLVYLYHYAGFIFLLLSVYRGYKVIFVNEVKDETEGDCEQKNSFSSSFIEKIAISTVKDFFGIKA